MRKFDVMKKIAEVKGTVPEKLDLPGECLIAIKDNSGVMLKTILIISELLRKRMGDEEYFTLTDTQKEQAFVITDILQMENAKHIRYVNAFMKGLTGEATSQMQRKEEMA